MVIMQTRGQARMETASLILHALVARVATSVSRPGADHTMLKPTIFVPVRRGDDVTFSDVVASKV